MKKLAAILILSIIPICNAMQTSIVSTTGWVGTPTIVTIADPAQKAVSGEGLVDPRNCYAQTFKVLSGSALKLDKIAIWERGAEPTQNPYTLRFVDLGTTDPSYEGGGSQTYPAGTDLWGGTVTYTYYGNDVVSALEFDFEGAEELTLTANHYYAFEITAATPVGGIFWYRANLADSLYPNGAAFLDTVSSTPGTRDQLYKGTIGRDMAMAVYLIPEPATLILLVLGASITLKRK